MKKSLIYIFAAAAMLAGCAKEGIKPVEEEIVNIPEGAFSASFVAPNATKTHFDAGTYRVLWNQNDKITVNGVEYQAETLYEGDTKAIFTPVGQIAEEAVTYTAYYNGNEAPASSNGTVAELPMMAVSNSQILNFENICAVLEITTLAEENIKTLKITANNGDNNKEITVTCQSTVNYVALNPGTYQLTIEGYKEGVSTSVRTMTTAAQVAVAKNTIYPIIFGDIYYVEAATTAVEIDSKGTAYVSFKEDNAQESLTIEYKEAGNKPENVVINVNGLSASNLVINLPETHVDIVNGSAANVTSQTSATTLVLNSDFHITETLTVDKGAVAVSAMKVSETKTEPNVKKIVINEGATGVKVSVAPVTAENPNTSKVVIVSQTAQPVEVVGTENEVYINNEAEGSSQNITLVNPVAAIGDQQYSSLAEAVAAAKDGDVVVLRQNVDVTACGIQVTSKNITLDLNGNEIMAGESDATNIRIDAGAALNVKDSKTGGKIYSTTAYSNVNNMGVVDSYGNFTLESGVIEAVLSDPVNNGQFGITAHNGASVTINGGTVKAGWYALTTNGTDKGKNILTVNGGNLISVADYAIYNPAENSQVVINGGVVSGAAGAITLNGGSMKMTNGVMTTKGTGNTGNWSDGTGKLGTSAINVNAKYTASSVEISGGQVIAEGNTPVFALGTANKATISLTGGTYSAKPDDAYLAEDYEAKDNGDGTYTVVKKQGPAYAAKIGDTEYETLYEALKAACDAKSGSAYTTVEIAKDLTFEDGAAWTPVEFNYGKVYVKGNNHTITNLPGMLFDKTGSGGHFLKMENLTIDGAKVLTSKDYGLGGATAVICGYADSMNELYFENVTIKKSTVTGTNYAAAFVAYAAGYSKTNDGPVFQEVTFKNCTVEGCTISGGGSTGALMGHAAGSTWANIAVDGSTISNNTITCTGSSSNKAGSLFGTAGNAGAVTEGLPAGKKTGLFVSATVSGNTVKSASTTITTICGRQGSTGGRLVMTAGGSYDAAPYKESDTAWASCAEGLSLVEKNGKWTVE